VDLILRLRNDANAFIDTNKDNEQKIYEKNQKNKEIVYNNE